MIMYRIPTLAYFEDMSGNIPTDYCIICSNAIFNKFNAMETIPSPYYQVGDSAGIDLFNEIKAACGDYILTRNFPMLCNIKGKENLYEVFAQQPIHNAFSLAGFNVNYITLAYGGGSQPTRLVNMNDGTDLTIQPGDNVGYFSSYAVATGNAQVYVRNISSAATPGSHTFLSTSSSRRYIQTRINVYPEDIFINGKIDVSKYTAEGSNYFVPSFEMIIDFDSNYTKVTGLVIWNIYRENFSDLHAFTVSHATADGPATQTSDADNPYGDHNSGIGGGNGHYGDIDSVDGASIPDLPDVTAADLGFITMYNPTKAQLIALSNFMWSGLFDLDTYKKLFSDPMESIIGLSIVPVAPTIGGTKNVMFGSIDSGVSMSYLSTQYVQFNCGSVTIDDYVGSFLDYSPYTKISIYLPYIGIHELSPDDIMNDTINVTYNIDVLSGACGAFISSSKKGVLYSYNGSCISNIPLTSINFSSAIQNAVSAVCSGAAIVAGVASGNAPITAMGAASMLGSAANTALNSKPSVQRSGSLGGSAGILSVQKPYLIIERPNLSVPANVQKYVGQTSNITATLSTLSGFTMVEYVHIEGVPATDEEIKEIEQLLKEGVYL